jgi:hypothetical protein
LLLLGLDCTRPNQSNNSTTTTLPYICSDIETRVLADSASIFFYYDKDDHMHEPFNPNPINSDWLSEISRRRILLCM